MSDPSGIHLNIEYPKSGEGDGGMEKLHLQTETNEAGKLELKTPVIIMAPMPAVDYQRLYEKIMKKRVEPHTEQKENIEKDAIYNEKVAYSDPVSRRELLFELLKDAEAKLAFYRADFSEVELLVAITDPKYKMKR